MVSFDLSSTGTMKKSSVWCRRCYRTPIEPIYVSDYGPDHFHRPIYMDFPEDIGNILETKEFLHVSVKKQRPARRT